MSPRGSVLVPAQEPPRGGHRSPREEGPPGHRCSPGLAEQRRSGTAWGPGPPAHDPSPLRGSWLYADVTGTSFLLGSDPLAGTAPVCGPRAPALDPWLLAAAWPPRREATVPFQACPPSGHDPVGLPCGDRTQAPRGTWQPLPSTGHLPDWRWVTCLHRLVATHPPSRSLTSNHSAQAGSQSENAK